MQALIPSVILSPCFEGAVTQRQALLSVWTQYTSTADVTIAADIDSSGLGPRRCHSYCGPDAESRGTEAVS